MTKRNAKHDRDAAGDRRGEEARARRERLDAKLDEALEETFPASDPIQIEPERDGSRPARRAADGARTGSSATA